MRGENNDQETRRKGKLKEDRVREVKSMGGDKMRSMSSVRVTHHR